MSTTDWMQPLAKWRTVFVGWQSVLVDVGIRALKRANRITETRGYIDLVEAERPKQQRTPAVVIEAIPGPAAAADTRAHTGTKPNGNHPWQQPTIPLEERDPLEPPTAAEEVEARLAPDYQLYECTRCHEPQPNGAFRHSSLGRRFKVCRRCDWEVRGRVSRKSPIPGLQKLDGCDEPTASPDQQSDSVVGRLQSQAAELALDIEELPREIERLEKEQADSVELLAAKRLALTEVQGVLERLRKLVPEAFESGSPE